MRLDHCTICAAASCNSESRTLTIFNGRLEVSRPGKVIWTALDDERACSCGQTHALALTERYLERGTFAPADFSHVPAAEVAALETNTL